jgi:hypothetical protein
MMRPQARKNDALSSGLFADWGQIVSSPLFAGTTDIEMLMDKHGCEWVAERIGDGDDPGG